MSEFRDIRLDLGTAPRVGNSWTFLYVEHRRIHQDAFGIQIESDKGSVQIPVSQIRVLFLGPGVSITSAAILALADHGCSVAWVGESGVRFYASGSSLTDKPDNAMAQARIWADPSQNRKVIRRMYVKRYGEDFPDLGTLAQLRGCEGARVKQAYLDESARLGLTWHGRRWTRGQWDITDQMNRCLSVASSCLYGLCQAVIVSMGFNPALGFIHTDNTRAFAQSI